MNPIFISYRREDGIEIAQLLQLNLQKVFGEDAVFLDTNTMKPGDEFPVYLQHAVRNAKVVIVMIGKNWKGSDPQKNRLSDEDDWVRKELEIALEKTDAIKKIFPVLVKGAKSDESFKELPPSLQRLSAYNCLTVREQEFSHDLLPLIPAIEMFVDINDPLRDLPLDETAYRYPAGSPFKGLDYFTEKDAKLFFGRGQEIRQLYNIICERNIVFFYGQSGVGKSSLLFAGIKPRMNCKGWTIFYIRRETGVDLAVKLREYISNRTSPGKQLVILDQVEEIYTNPDTERSIQEESEQLLKEVLRATEANLHIILSFRKEYLAEFKNLFLNLEVEDFYLKPLQLNGVLNAIRGVTEHQKARDIYQLQFSDNTVPATIAQAILSDEQSHVAPLLQILLRKMWDKVSEKRPRIFSKELFEEVKSHSLFALLNDQLAVVSIKYPREIASGLVLDILHFFTTVRSTSASHTVEELSDRYASPVIAELVAELKNRYLLTEPKEGNVNVVRLAHDALAPIIREMYSNSTLPGQRASSLLDSKKYEIENDPDNVEFSKADLSIIDAGKPGMRKYTNAETREIEQSRQRIKLDEEVRELAKRKQLRRTRIFAGVVCTFTVVAIAIAIYAFGKNKLANSNYWLSEARSALERNDVNLALRLAGVSVETYRDSVNVAFATAIYTANNFYKTEFRAHSGRIQSVAYSPDGKSILTGSIDSTARLWGLNGTMLREFKGHSGWVQSVAFSPDGKYILTGASDSIARLLDLNGTMIREFKGHFGSIYSVAFSPKGNCILTGCEDGIARLWDLKANILQEFRGHPGGVRSVAFSLDGNSIVTSSWDETVRLRDLSGNILSEFRDHSGGVDWAAFSPDGKILTVSDDDTARLWDLKGTLFREFPDHLGTANSVAFSPDGSGFLAGSGDGTARLLNLHGKTVAEFKGHSGGVSAVAFSPDGNSFITCSGDGITRQWDLYGTMVMEFESQSGRVEDGAFSPDGQNILTGSADSTARICDLKGNILKEFKGHSRGVLSVAFSPDGKNILTGSFDSTARLWDVDGTMFREFKGYSDWVRCVAFSPDGKHILIGIDTIGLLLDLHGNQISEFKSSSQGYFSASFSPDGKSVLIGNSHGSKLFDLKGNLLRQFKGKPHDSWPIAISPDGKTILTGSWETDPCLWDWNGTMLRRFEGPLGTVRSVAFSHDGQYIIAGYDETASLWDLQGNLLQEFRDHSGGFRDIKFSPDDKSILVVSNGTARLYELMSFEEFLNRDMIPPLTPEQKKKYRIE